MDIRLIAGISALSVVIVMWLYYILKDRKYFLNLGKSKKKFLKIFYHNFYVYLLDF